MSVFEDFHTLVAGTHSRPATIGGVAIEHILQRFGVDLPENLLSRSMRTLHWCTRRLLGLGMGGKLLVAPLPGRSDQA